MRLEERERDREIKEKGSVTGGAVFKKHIQKCCNFFERERERKNSKFENICEN